MNSSFLIIETALFAIGFFCTLLSSIVLLSSHDGRSPANRFLVYFLFTMSMVLFMSFMILGKFIIQIPWLYRLPSPLYYFLFPSAYIYVRMVLFDERHARKTDWLHAIPAFLHLGEMMPYYLSSNEFKMAKILEDSLNPLGTVAHSEGLLPEYMHNLLRGFQGVIYALVIIFMLWKSTKKRRLSRFVYPEMMQWLWVFASMILLFSSALVFTFINTGINITSRSIFLFITMAGTQIIAGFYLLLKPSILFGMPKLEKMVAMLRVIRKERDGGNADSSMGTRLPAENAVPAGGIGATDANDFPLAEFPEIDKAGLDLNEAKKGSTKFSQSKYDEYMSILAQLMEEEKPFLRKRYSINDLSNDLKVPQHHISYLLNNILNVRFNDYINQFRLEYIKERLSNEKLGHLTLEGIALEAGFTSRITFFRVVQKQTGMNPSEYFKLDLADTG